MSIEAMAAVLGYSMGNGNGVRKLILLGYANHADKFGRDAYPSTQTVAEYAECDVRTVRRHVGWLLSAGYLREGDQQAASHIEARHRPIVYDVATSTGQAKEWSTDPQPTTGLRAKAVETGRLGGRASAQANRGDSMSPLTPPTSPQVGTGDVVSPLEDVHRGDAGGGSGVTHQPVRGDSRGDTGVTRTLEPSTEPSSSRARDDGARDVLDAPAGGGGDQPLAHTLDVLPETVRDHPSVVPSAIAHRIGTLHDLGWPTAEIRRRLSGVETADKPGAAALTRLANLEQLGPPALTPVRPRWCGRCDQHTRMREDPDRDDRPYPCLACHPRAAAAPA